MNKKIQSIPVLYQRLWNHLTRRRRWQFALLLILMVLVSFAEIMSIGAVLPFLSVLISPDRVFGHPVAQPFIAVLEIQTSREMLFPITVLFALAALLAGGMRILLLWASIRLSFAAGADLSYNIYRRTLYQPYSVHCVRNSSEVIDGISNKANGVIYNAIVPALTVLSSAVMLVGILIILFAVDPIIAMSALGGGGFVYGGIIYLTRNRLLVNSQRIAHETSSVIKSLQEGLGGIRNVLIDGTQSFYCRIYRSADLPLRRAQGINFFISMAPRYGVEALGMVLIAILAFFLAQEADGVAGAIPVLGTLALGAQRLLPVLQQMYGAWSSIRGGQASWRDAIELLDQPLPDYMEQSVSSSMSFKKQIVLKNLSFRHTPETPEVLADLELTIPKGSRVGIVGATGSGKSTLLDIIMGLLQPTEGVLEIDDKSVTLQNIRSWQAHIAHVPQAIYLADNSIAENIAFGISREHIDHDRVKQAARQAQISNVIDKWPDQYQTIVGEGGIRLSGGQRQRIGIARALYKHADVIVFDEATSALDNDTEESVIQAIEGISKDITIIMATHRLSTLKECSMIIDLTAGKTQKTDKFSDIID